MMKLKALILSGGKSRRMGRDKSALRYFDKPQVQYLYDQVSELCESVFISCRPEQTSEDHLRHLPQIVDAYGDIGPLGGILSAMKHDPEAAWLVLACDLPFVDQKTLGYLVQEREPLKEATCFTNTDKGWKEPLCAIWEPSSRKNLLKAFEEDRRCPRKILSELSTKTLIPYEEKALDNVNTPEEFQQTQTVLKG